MRISRPQMFMSMCEVAAQRSTCFRGNVGAFVVHNNDVISMGYNGPKSGEEHCTGNECPLSQTGSCSRSIHAEMNAFNRAFDKVGTVAGMTLYCTSAPCFECAKSIKELGISVLYYRHPYRISHGLDLLLLHSAVNIFRVTPSGFIIDERTNTIQSN